MRAPQKSGRIKPHLLDTKLDILQSGIFLYCKMKHAEEKSTVYPSDQRPGRSNMHTGVCCCALGPVWVSSHSCG